MNRLLPLLVAAALSLSACGAAKSATQSETATPVNRPSTKVVSESVTCVALYGASEDGPLFVAIDAMKELTGEGALSDELTAKIRDVSNDLEKISSSATTELKEHTDSVNEAFIGFLAATGSSYEVKVESFKSGASELLARCPALVSKKSTPTRTPTPTPRQISATYALTCQADGKRIARFSSYQEAWASPSAVNACMVGISKGEPSAWEKELAVEAYGNEAAPSSAAYLHSICASTTGHYIYGPLSGVQVLEVRAAMKLCPDHPKRAQMEAIAAPR